MEEVKNIFNLFLIISAIHGFVFSFLLVFSKRALAKDVLFLNFLMLAMSLNNFQSWIISHKIYPDSYWLDYFSFPWHFLLAPLFLLFLVNYLQVEQKVYRWLTSKVFMLFGLMVVIRWGYIYYFHETHGTIFRFSEQEIIYSYTEELFSFFSSIAIFYYAYYIVRHKKNLYEKILTYDSLRWIHIFFKLATITYSTWLIALVGSILIDGKSFIYAYYPLRVFTTILIYWVGYQALIQMRLMRERINIRKLSVTSNQIPEEQNKALDEFADIENLIIKNKLFLDPKLSLDKVALETGKSGSTISKLVNEHTQKNFSEYINYLRVEQAKVFLLEDQYKKYTVLAIGLESGFNSKSSFYSVFKKFTGLTPTNYRKKHLNEKF